MQGILIWASFKNLIGIMPGFAIKVETGGKMKTHSIQFKFLTTIISAMLAITVFVGGLSIYEVDKFVQYQTENFINVTCE